MAARLDLVRTVTINCQKEPSQVIALSLKVQGY